MNKKEVFLKILSRLNTGNFLCTSATLLRMQWEITQAEEQAFIQWIRGMLTNNHYTVIGWLREYHPDFYYEVDSKEYRKAWVAHLIAYLESLP